VYCTCPFRVDKVLYELCDVLVLHRDTTAFGTLYRAPRIMSCGTRTISVQCMHHHHQIQQPSSRGNNNISEVHTIQLLPQITRIASDPFVRVKTRALLRFVVVSNNDDVRITFESVLEVVAGRRY